MFVLTFSNHFVKHSSYGQNSMTSTYEGETLFSIGICIMGLVLFAHLIGNMQVFFALFLNDVFINYCFSIIIVSFFFS